MGGLSRPAGSVRRGDAAGPSAISRPTSPEAQKIVRRCLQCRATAPRRIGVGYQLRELDNSDQWIISPPVRVLHFVKTDIG